MSIEFSSDSFQSLVGPSTIVVSQTSSQHAKKKEREKNRSVTLGQRKQSYSNNLQIEASDALYTQGFKQLFPCPRASS